MVCLIQRSQNTDALAMHLTLNELVAVRQGASTRLIEVEDARHRHTRKVQVAAKVGPSIS
jgi:low affinity Fe/Cu permease